MSQEKQMQLSFCSDKCLCIERADAKFAPASLTINLTWLWSSFSPPNAECGDLSPLSEPCGDESPHSPNSPIGLNDDQGHVTLL